MYFFSFYMGILLFVEKTDGSQRGIRFDNKDLFHIRRIAQPDPLSGKAAVDFIFHLVNDNYIVCRYTSFNFKKEIPFYLFRREPADLLRF